MTDASDQNPFKTPIMPVKLSPGDTIQFNCHKGIACFNKCCQQIDLTLAPYDIVRLKNRLGLTSREFLAQYTVPFSMDGQEMPGIKMRTKDDSTACPLLTDAGCSVYEDRPTACRYYALGQMAMRKMGSSSDEEMYFVVKEDHCLGHQEPVTLTVGDYRKEQGVEDYDEINRGWRQVILKKRSSGPTVGKPSTRSYQLFFMASYDMDTFLEFILSDGFNQVYDLDAETVELLKNDEAERVKFGARFLKQVLFGELTIPIKQDALEKRLEKRRAEIAARKASERSGDFDARYDGPAEDGAI